VIAAALVLGAAATIAPLPHSRTGNGKDALVLVHGLGGDRHAWDGVVPELAKSFTVITVDLPAHGEAPAPAKYDADEIAKRIVATADAEGFGPSRRVLVGHSLGGYIVAHAGGEKLALVDIGVGTLFSSQELEELRANLKKDRESTLKAWFGAISKPAQLPRILPGARKLSDEALLGYATMMGTQPVRDPVGGLLMASKMLLPGKRAQKDELRTLGFVTARYLQVVHFADSMHWIFWDEPQKFVATLVDFARAELR
jgi:pimeloyl-ACP methyl ester carboxylesterase